MLQKNLDWPFIGEDNASSYHSRRSLLFHRNLPFICVFRSSLWHLHHVNVWITNSILLRFDIFGHRFHLRHWLSNSTRRGRVLVCAPGWVIEITCIRESAVRHVSLMFVKACCTRNELFSLAVRYSGQGRSNKGLLCLNESYTAQRRVW